jgi:hypothetical protein
MAVILFVLTLLMVASLPLSNSNTAPTVPIVDKIGRAHMALTENGSIWRMYLAQYLTHSLAHCWCCQTVLSASLTHLMTLRIIPRKARWVIIMQFNLTKVSNHRQQPPKLFHRHAALREMHNLQLRSQT